MVNNQNYGASLKQRNSNNLNYMIVPPQNVQSAGISVVGTHWPCLRDERDRKIWY
jgi:hypothetical protein